MATLLRKARGERTAFTLIELLVVIAIIALLIGILLPALAKARRSSQRVVDASNQRQIGIGAAFYAEEYDGYQPRESSGGGTDGGPCASRPGWASAFRPFLDGDGYAPEDKFVTEGNDVFDGMEIYKDPARPRDDHPLNYVVNAFTFIESGRVAAVNTRRLERAKPATKLSSVAFTAKTIYLTNLSPDEDGRFIRNIPGSNREFEDTADFEVEFFYDVWQVNHLLETSVEARVAPEWYDRGPNCLFFDGHVDLVDSEAIRDVNTWNDRDYTWWRRVTSPSYDDCRECMDDPTLCP
ncbi:MAG: prepilin-type N-terminal cleavage/methylation domain-containing protein [Planctomycetota bacterium]